MNIAHDHRTSYINSTWYYQILPKNLNVKHNTSTSVYSQILIFQPPWEQEYISYPRIQDTAVKNS